MKICNRCLCEKSEKDFYLKDNSCKECRKKIVRENRKKNIEYYVSYEKERAMLPHRVAARSRYQETDAGKESIARSRKKYIERNPLKRAAHIVVGNYIRDGKLIRTPCEICGNVIVHAHHDDYGEPLSVRWLCTKHHAEWHRKNKPKYGEIIQ